MDGSVMLYKVALLHYYNVTGRIGDQRFIRKPQSTKRAQIVKYEDQPHPTIFSQCSCPH